MGRERQKEKERSFSGVDEDMRKEGRWKRSPGLDFKEFFSVSYSYSLGLETPTFFWSLLLTLIL